MLLELERKVRGKPAAPLNWLCHAVHNKCLIIGLPLLSQPHDRYFPGVSFCFGNACTSFVTTLDSLCEPEENRYLNENSNVFLFFTNVCIFQVSLRLQLFKYKVTTFERFFRFFTFLMSFLKHFVKKTTVVNVLLGTSQVIGQRSQFRICPK